MAVKMTKFGILAINKLSNLWTLSLLIPSDNRSFNQKLHEAHERRKSDALASLRKMMEPTLPEGANVEDHISYTGEDGSVKNAPYSEALEQFVARSTLCSAVDIYHWYLRRVIEEALRSDRSLIRAWAKTLNLPEKKITAIETTQDLASEMSTIFSEDPFRRLAHIYLNVPDLELVPLIVKVRNCIVHELGEDRTGRVAKALAENDSPCGIQISEGQVFFSADTANEIVGRFVSDISIMDHALGYLLGLPTADGPFSDISRSYS
jgi:hypothetical protein